MGDEKMKTLLFNCKRYAWLAAAILASASCSVRLEILSFAQG
jgi:hypothetical protein